jgi:hypothetical protein
LDCGAVDIKPHLSRTFKLSNDKRFEEKFWDVIGIRTAFGLRRRNLVQAVGGFALMARPTKGGRAGELRDA